MYRMLLLTLVLTTTATVGCVHRRVEINSQPSGALVVRNGQPIGYTPCDDVILYYGKYRYTLVKEGYQTLTEERDIKAPWYQWPGIDFFAENVYPGRLFDVRRLDFTMQPARFPTSAEVLERGQLLRNEGRQIGDVPSLPPATAPAPPVAGGPGVPRN